MGDNRRYFVQLIFYVKITLVGKDEYLEILLGDLQVRLGS